MPCEPSGQLSLPPGIRPMPAIQPRVRVRLLPRLQRPAVSWLRVFSSAVVLLPGGSRLRLVFLFAPILHVLVPVLDGRLIRDAATQPRPARICPRLLHGSLEHEGPGGFRGFLIA